MRPGLIAGVVLVVVGIVLLAVSKTTVPDAVGFACLGLGGIALTGLLFYAIGRGEDRAREAERHRDDAGG